MDGEALDAEASCLADAKALDIAVAALTDTAWEPLFETRGKLFTAAAAAVAGLGEGLLTPAGEPGHVAPGAERLFAALAKIPGGPSDVKATVLGLDPYPTGATGLAFDCGAGPVRDSLKNILDAIAHQGLAVDLARRRKKYLPGDGDLTPWAVAGILLLNTALTLGPDKKSGGHVKRWRPFTNALLSTVGSATESPPPVLAWGTKAIAAAKSAAKSAAATIPVWEWNHPSPLAQNLLAAKERKANVPESESKLFLHNPCFTRLATSSPRILFALDTAGIGTYFSDGACSGNGRSNPRAGYGAAAVRGPATGLHTSGPVLDSFFVFEKSGLRAVPSAEYFERWGSGEWLPEVAAELENEQAPGATPDFSKMKPGEIIEAMEAAEKRAAERRGLAWPPSTRAPPPPSNNRAELLGFIAGAEIALSAGGRAGPVVFVSDSRYVLGLLGGGLQKRRAHGGLGKSGLRGLKNLDLVLAAEAALNAVAEHTGSMPMLRWVKGHGRLEDVKGAAELASWLSIAVVDRLASTAASN